MSKLLSSTRDALITKWFIRAVILFLPLLCCSKTEQFQITNKDKAKAPIQFNIESDSAIISWNDTAKASDSVLYYQLYYRPVNSSSWHLLKTDLKNKQVVLYRKELDTTETVFILAVQSVASNGKTSGYHASTDISASPSEWIVSWEAK